MKPGWTTVALGDVCDINIGRTPSRARTDYWGQGEPWLSIADMNQGRLITTTKEQVTPLAVKEAVARPVSPGTVILSFKLSIGKVGIAQRRMFTNEAIAALPIRSGVALDADYLAWALQHLNLTATSNRAAMGATLNKASLALVQFPLPPIEEQRRIAAILDKVSGLLRRSASMSSMLADLESRALTRTASAAGQTSCLSELADFYGGSSLPSAEPFEGQVGGYLLLRVSDMNRPGNDVQIVSAAAWSSMPGPKASTCPAGSIVIPKRGGAIGTNKKRLTSRPSILDPNLMAITPRRGAVDLSYLFAWFKRFDLSSLTSGSSVPQLNKQDLAPLQVPVPDQEAQAAFSRIARAIATQRELAEANHDLLTELMDALQARAFSGRL